MPKWNLENDYSPSHKPKGVTMFSLPIRQLNLPLHKYKLAVEVEQQSNKCVGKGNKKLIIDIDTSQNVEVLAMTPGKISSAGSCLSLGTQTFFTIGTLAFNSRYRKDESSLPFTWFANWMEASLIPGKIIYDNVVPGKKTAGNVRSGEVIGTVGTHPDNPALKRLILSIAYAGPIKGTWDGMHTREFFSLLFWKEEHDPVLKQSPTPYDHELLQVMMGTDQEGKKGLPNSFINAPTDIWLGLRPPLRTFQRVKWEHIKEQLRSDYDWSAFADVAKRFMNPFIYKHGDPGQPGYSGVSKCNNYAGEMLFRAGFKTITYGQGIPGCKSLNVLPAWVKYSSPGVLRTIFSTSKKHTRNPDKIHYIDEKWQKACSQSTSATHHLSGVFATKVTNFTMESINGDIEKNGATYLFPTYAHVPIIHKVTHCISIVNIKAIDQTDHSNPRAVYSRKYPPLLDIDKQDALILRVLPGGDPTEEWGMLKSNCLETIKKGP